MDIKAAAAAAAAEAEGLSGASVVKPGQTGREAADLKMSSGSLPCAPQSDFFLSI